MFNDTPARKTDRLCGVKDKKIKKLINNNCVVFRDSKIPIAPHGHKWKEVRHDNSVSVNCQFNL